MITDPRFTNTVLMVRPMNFGFNPETSHSNTFQKEKSDLPDADAIKQSGLEEFDTIVENLRMHDIEVIVIDDTPEPAKYDAIFPNNWFSTHRNGSIVTYPMESKNRRTERRTDIIDMLNAKFNYDKLYNFDYLEEEDQFLEGTGSMILDRKLKKLYAGISSRTNIIALEKFAVLMGYEKVVFHAKDKNNQAIYHTNVMMALANNFAVICEECIHNPDELENLRSHLQNSGYQIVAITHKQMESFSGNMLQLITKSGEYLLVMSQSSFDCLDMEQLSIISSSSKILPLKLPTIEQIGGGSIRCMLAEIFIP